MWKCLSLNGNMKQTLNISLKSYILRVACIIISMQLMNIYVHVLNIKKQWTIELLSNRFITYILDCFFLIILINFDNRENKNMFLHIEISRKLCIGQYVHIYYISTCIYTSKYNQSTRNTLILSSINHVWSEMTTIHITSIILL